MYCKKCGFQIDDDSVFCQKCGKKQTCENDMVDIYSYSDESFDDYDDYDDYEDYDDYDDYDDSEIEVGSILYVIKNHINLPAVGSKCKVVKKPEIINGEEIVMVKGPYKTDDTSSDKVDWFSMNISYFSSVPPSQETIIKSKRRKRKDILSIVLVSILIITVIAIVMGVNTYRSGGKTENNVSEHSRCVLIGYVNPNDINTLYNGPGRGLVPLYANSTVGSHTHY
jgi:hypothetical protein